MNFPDRMDVSPHAIRTINSGYLYYLSKYVDLLDTIFFVLRKKYNQITTLHMYHHTVVPTLGWACMKIGPTVPALGLFAVLNSLIHVIMYSYYGLAACGPHMQKYLWWKKHLTLIQLTQFIVLAFYGVIIARFLRGYRPFYFWAAMSQVVVFMYMFYNFYKQAYISTNNRRNNVPENHNKVIRLEAKNSSDKANSSKKAN